jgi:hypothetical protein
MTCQTDLAIMIKDPLTLAVSPGLILAVIVCELPLPPPLRLRCLLVVMLELRLRSPVFFFMPTAGGRAERAQPRRRLDLIGTLVGHHDRNSQWSRSERRNVDFLYQLLKPERWRRQDVLQNASQPCDLGIQLPRSGRAVHLSTLLIGAQRLTLISCLSANHGTLRAFLFQLLSAPCSLLRLVQTLLTALRLRPGCKYTTIPTSCHGSSQGNNTISMKRGFRNLPYGDSWEEDQG